jgi:hypothetical protein
MMTLISIIGLLVAAGILYRYRRLDIALIFAALAVVCWRDENMNTGEWWIFGISFVIALAIVIGTVRWPGRRHLGVGIAMLLLAFVLSSTWSLSAPFEDWVGWIISILLIVAVAIIAWMMFANAGVVVLAAFLVAGILAAGTLWGNITGPHRGPEARQTPNPTATTTTTGTPTPSVTASQPPSDGTAGIEDSDGEKKVLPLVDQKGDRVTPADTTSDSRSPSSYADALRGGSVRNWSDLVSRMGNMQWYVNGVNARKGKTGFDWSDVEKWAKDGQGFDTRVIQVYNLSPGQLSDQAARDHVRGLFGSDADKLPIARHYCAVNTRGLGNGNLQDFVDCRQMVRGSLAPLVYKDGKPVAVDGDSGIFVDCFNVWWLPRQVVKHGPPPTKTTAPPTKTPVPTPTPSKTLSPKKLSDHPAVNGNGPAVQWDPAPAPTSTASAPGGYSAPKSTATGTPSPTSTSTSTPIVVDPNPSNTPTSPPTW